MKKAIGVYFILIFAILSTSSCKKDYTCTCTTTITGVPATTTKFYLGKQKRKDAQAACSAYEASTTGTAITCKLQY